MAKTFKPFADSETSFGIGGLSIENGADRLAIYGNFELTRDKAGLEAARTLKALFADVVKTLEADKTLPEAVAAAPAPQSAPSGGLDLPTGGLAKP